MRARYIDQALAGIFALQPTHQAGLDYISVNVKRLRHLIWNGYADKAGQALWALTHLASKAGLPQWGALRLGGTQVSAPLSGATHLLGQQRQCAHRLAPVTGPGRPISSSRAESSVAEIANARTAKRQRMRWLPRGTHCVATVRAAVLNGRLHKLTSTRFAA